MTMPSLIQNYKDKELINRTKKAYAVIQNAISLAQVENGTIGDNTFLFDTTKTSAQVAENFSKYFNGAKLCQDSKTEGCNEFFYYIKYASKVGTQNLKNPKIILNDGTVIDILQRSACIREINDCEQDSAGNCIKDSNGDIIPRTSTHYDCATLYVDVNGPKLPNQFGRDSYVLKVYANKIFPSAWAPEGAASFKNIISGKDKLEYIKF